MNYCPLLEPAKCQVTIQIYIYKKNSPNIKSKVIQKIKASHDVVVTIQSHFIPLRHRSVEVALLQKKEKSLNNVNRHRVRPRPKLTPANGRKTPLSSKKNI